MRPIQIMTDSCADFEDSLIKDFDIRCIDFSFVRKGKESLVGVGYDNKVKANDIFSSLENGERIYMLPATKYEIEKKLRESLDEGKDIIYIGCCIKQSRTIEKVRQVVSKLAGEYENRIEVIDSLNATAGQALLVLEACKMNAAGKDFDEIKETIYRIRKNIIQFATPESLTYMSRQKKVSSSAEIFGNLFDIKPILISDKNGVQCSFSKVRGRTKSLLEIVRLFKENVENSEDQDIIIIHGNDLESANFVKEELLKDDFKCKAIHTVMIGPSVGITMGPGLVGIFGFGKKVTFDAGI